MIRSLFAVLGGGAMALGLFWLLALMVAPPERSVERTDVAVPLRLVSMGEVAHPAVPDVPPGQPETPLPETEADVVDERSDAPPLTEREPPPDQAAERETRPAPDPAPTPEAAPVTDSAPEPEPEPEPEPVPDPEPAPEPESASEPTPEREPAPSMSSTSAPAGEAEDVPAESSRQTATAESAGAGSEASDAPVEVGEAIPVSRVPPSYPRRALRRGVEGHVVLAFLIQPDGRVDPSSIRVLEAQPRRAFEAAAESAVAEWRFAPDGRLRRARQRLEFQLR